LLSSLARFLLYSAQFKYLVERNMASNTFSFTPQKRGSYKPVPQESQVEDQVQAPTSRWRSSKRTLIFGTSHPSLSSPSSFSLLSSSPPTTAPSNDLYIMRLHPSEARSRNCSFDLISFAWQLPPCYDAPLIAEFQSWSNWTLYNTNTHSFPIHHHMSLSPLPYKVRPISGRLEIPYHALHVYVATDA